MNINLQQTSDTKEFKERQQQIDAILVLSKLLEINMTVPEDITRKAQAKISTLIDKI